jgi:hypothetical protein
LLAARNTAAAGQDVVVREVLVNPFIDRAPVPEAAVCRRALEHGAQAGIHDIESVVDLLAETPELLCRCECDPVGMLDREAVARRDEGLRQIREVDCLGRRRRR